MKTPVKISIKVVFTALFIFVASVGFAPPPPPPGSGSGPACWPPPCVPIDNGIIFLIVIVALYGGKKLYTFHKKAKA
jgi:hypothetical protein